MIERIKEYISLNFRSTLKSDNVNDTMVFNRMLSNPLIIFGIIICMDIVFVLIANFVINVFSHLPEMIADPSLVDTYISVSSIAPAFSDAGSMTKAAYGIVFFLLIIFSIKKAYEMRVSYSEEDINKGNEGTSRWTTLPEIMKQYKRIPMMPSKSRMEKVSEDEIIEAGDGKYVLKEGKLPVCGGSYIENIKYDENGIPVEKEVKTPNWYKGKGGLPVTRWRDSLYIDSQLTNNLFLGTTRSGKGEMFVFTLIDILSRAYRMDDRPSMIIFDPKLELYKGSKHTLEKRGYTTRLLNLDNPKKSAGYNPLAIITEYYAEGKQDEAQQLAKSFSFSIFNSARDNQEPIWKNTSTDLFTALILAVVSDSIEMDDELNVGRRKALLHLKSQFDEIDAVEEKEDARKRFYDAISDMKEDEDVISVIRDHGITAVPPEYELTPIYPNRKNINCYSVITFFRELCDVTSITAGNEAAGAKKAETALDDYFNRRPVLDYARGLYASIKVAGDRTKGSIFVNMQSALTIFSMDSIARMTAENDIDFKSIGFGENPVAIFLGLPTEDKSNHFLALNFVTQVFQYLFKLAKAGNGKLDRNVRFILDEFGNMPILDNFGSMVTNCLGVGFSFDIFIQSYNQLHTNYEMEKDTIKDNFANQIYILAMGNDTAEEFSEQLGNKTVIELQRSGTRFGNNKTFMENTKERPLLFPKELKEFREGEVAIIRGSKRTAVSGAAVKAYPILCEYLPELHFWQYIRGYFAVMIRRKNAPMRNRDTGEELSFSQEYENYISGLKRRLGTAFLYRYEYATSDFPNPNDIQLSDILDESRENVEYTKLVYDTGKLLGELSGMPYIPQNEERRKHLSDIPEKYTFLNNLALLYGDDFEERFNINEESDISDLLDFLDEKRKTEPQNAEQIARLRSILLRN